MPATDPALAAAAPQRVAKVRRDYNRWVASETLEDYALRYAPQRFRKWSPARVANTAFGAASFLILEAVGATLLVQYGFANAFWAIVATGLLIFLAGIPISTYAARHGVDMDLLTRGAGFGYIGSTVTSLIYASFTFIFFALEAAVMAYALELALDIPPRWGYLVCALVVIPLVTHGVSAISRLQVWTQPLWLVMLVVPFVYVLMRDPGAFSGVVHYAGEKTGSAGFTLHGFGAALTVGVALITQMGEQADYLRFMPPAARTGRWQWWAGVIVGGPGWVVPGVAKMLGGALLAWLAIDHMVPVERAVDPNQMYLAAYEYVFPHYGWAVAATALFVVVSQLKINVTNAYAGSLAWSNFFSRVTHSHPGRVVWVVFNTLIAFLLMEMNVFQALGEVLGLYANVAIAWIMAVVADLVVNKPLGLSPRGIEFKRAHLWDVNPVGVGAMALASALSVAAWLGAFGPMAQAWSAVIALGTAFVTAPAIAWATRGRYYLVRPAQPPRDPTALQRCVVCERLYEAPDMARCPAYRGRICSLCCTLEARCGDACRPQAKLAAQWSATLHALLPARAGRLLDSGLGHFLLLMLLVAPLLAGVFALLWQQELRALQGMEPQAAQAAAAALRAGFGKAYVGLVLVAGVLVWWLVLAHQSRRVAQQESNRQTTLLLREIALHRRTDRALQQAKRAADDARQAAEQANQAKSRYIGTISHELRTPLNSILGYAQLLGEDPALPPHRRQAVNVIRRGGEHLLSLIEGTLDIARIEAGKLTLVRSPMRFADCVHEMAELFELQAAAKGLGFRFEVQGPLPEVVRADEKRLRQILINLLGNAVKFTASGHVTLRVRHARQMATLEVEDTGPGMAEAELARVFEPFARGTGAAGHAPGAGLGLTIARMLADLMGGELTVRSAPGQGACFRVRLFLPQVEGAAARAPARARPAGYEGPRRLLLVVDNEEADRELLVEQLEPLGFAIRTAASGHDALDLLAAGLDPDALLLDLAMPGIDGWETLRRARALRPLRAQVAIVSANAFDKGLENDAGITVDDFLVKPVREAELLAWLRRALGLRWTEAGALPPAAPALPALPPTPAPLPAVAPDLLARLRESVALGYPRGVLGALDAIEAAQPAAGPWCGPLRTLAREFRFDLLAQRLAPAQGLP